MRQFSIEKIFEAVGSDYNGSGDCSLESRSNEELADMVRFCVGWINAAESGIKYFNDLCGIPDLPTNKSDAEK